MIRAACVALFLCAVLRPAAAAEPLKVPIAYLVRPETIETISLLDQPADNNGIAGAQLAVQDNNTTGRFLNQSFSLEAIKLHGRADPRRRRPSLPTVASHLFSPICPAGRLLRADRRGRAHRLIFFNVAATDDRLRQEECRANTIHVRRPARCSPTGSAQYLVWKHWRRWLLVLVRTSRTSFTQTRFAAQRFVSAPRSSRSACSRIPAARGAPTPALCRSKVKYPCSPNRHRPTTCWSPLTKARSSPLICPTAPASRGLLLVGRACARRVGTQRIDQWGAIQLQDRFRRMFSRRMTALDMQAWTAVRMIGEAVGADTVGRRG